MLHRLGLDLGPRPAAPHGESALWLVRFPRVALAAVVGAALGCAGAVMQGVFGNPLAEPGVIGVSSGAAVGAALAIVTGVTVLGGWTVPAAAFAGGLATTSLVYLLARSGGRTEVVTLVLTGIAVNAVAGAAIGLLDVRRRRVGRAGHRVLEPRQPGPGELVGGLAGRALPRGRAASPPSPTPAGSTCSPWASAPPATSASTWNGCGSG